MNRYRWWGLLLAVGLASPVWAQSSGRDPHLAYAYPAGCTQGTSCEIVVGGQFLKEATEVYLAGEGVEVEIVKWYRPMTNGEYNNLRMKLSDTRELLIEQRKLNGMDGPPTDAEVTEAAGVTEYQLQEMGLFEQRDRDPKRQPNDQLEEQVTLKMTVAEDAELGKRELRFLTDNAISNPLWLHIGKYAEIREQEPNDREAVETIYALPVVINGQIMPGDVDCFAFEARQGMRLVIEAGARDVIPYLADAVPGWFQAVMRLTDSAGNEVAFADSFHYRQDPVLYFEVPRDDRYTVEIRDALFRGREDFVYRIQLGQIPYVTSVFPLGARVDSELTVQLSGWNLTATEFQVETMSRRQYRPVRWYSAPQGSGVSVRFPLQIDPWPEVTDVEPNDDIARAQAISTRMTINGRIDRPGDQDVYLIEGGGRMVAEIHARRLGSPLDSMLTVTDEQGNEIAFNDDHKDLSQSMLTHHADSHLAASIPATGNHYLHVRDAQRNGGPEFIYRLCMRAPQSDYELRVVPSSIIARAGQVVPITVFALREDGFDQDIELKLLDAPEGFQLDGGMVPGPADRVQMTLTVPSTPPSEPVMLEMEGSAPRRLRSRSMIVRPAIPAENMMQAFIWYHLVPVENWTVVVSGRPGAKLPFQPVMTQPRLSLPRGGEARLNLMPLIKEFRPDQLHVELKDPPAGITASIVSDASGPPAIEFTTAVEEVEAGLRGNLLVSVYSEYTPQPSEDEPAPRPRRTDYGYLPAIPFEVAERKSVR
jgi:hypothetical protein